MVAVELALTELLAVEKGFMIVYEFGMRFTFFKMVNLARVGLVLILFATGSFSDSLLEEGDDPGIDIVLEAESLGEHIRILIAIDH